jgi:lipoate---protein ligase
VGTAGRKVKGGKLLRVRLEHDGSAITEVLITGDFFLHPEEGLAWLEEGLRGVPVRESERELALRIEGIVAEKHLMVLGFGPADLAATIKEAMA